MAIPTASNSPCTGVCTLDVDDVCLGCYRTGNDIMWWPHLCDEAKQTVLKQAKEREDEMALAHLPTHQPVECPATKET